MGKMHKAIFPLPAMRTQNEKLMVRHGSAYWTLYGQYRVPLWEKVVFLRALFTAERVQC
jgi:hypothetical protein